MNHSLVTANSISKITQKAIAFWVSLWDGQTGGFRFVSHQPATLMATAYCVLGLEFTKGLSELSEEQKNAIVSFLMAGSQADGSFRDSLFRSEDILSKQHDVTYFNEETTTMCQQALDALAAPPPPPHDWKSDRRTAKSITSYLESLSWKNPWMDSNPVMFVLSQLCHDADRYQQPELLDIVDTALDWLDEHQSSQTGLWQGDYEVSLTNAMAATFHFTFFYGYRDRPLRYPERIIDSCLKLQEPHGLFYRNAIGQTCLDYDALDLLAKASLITDYRAEDIQNATSKAYEVLLKLYNPLDGGFANCKQTLKDPNKGRKGKILRSLGLAKLLPKPTYVEAQGNYDVCWLYLSCKSDRSNAFSTWFRLLALRLATQQQWLKDGSSNEFIFRRLPFLGYHTY